MAVNHLAAIQSGKVTKTNVIGIRKALNAEGRRSRGYSLGRGTPKLQGDELDELISTLHKSPPIVTGDLDASGYALLRSPRYRKRWTAAQAEIIARLNHFRLVGFIEIGRYHHPVYRAEAWCGSFDFFNVPWQSGGNGPEIWRG